MTHQPLRCFCKAVASLGAYPLLFALPFPLPCGGQPLKGPQYPYLLVSMPLGRHFQDKVTKSLHNLSLDQRKSVAFLWRGPRGEELTPPANGHQVAEVCQ